MTDDLLEEQVPPIAAGFTQMNWHSGFGRQIGPLYERDGELANYVRAFRVAEYHTNGMGNCHGGMLMAFADVAFGHAVSVALNHYWVTVRLLTDFMSGAKLGEWVEGSAEIVGHEDGFVTTKGRIWTGDRTLMTGTGVFKTLGERPKP